MSSQKPEKVLSKNFEINTKPAVKTPEKVLLHNFELQYEPAVWGNEPVESEAELRARLFFPLNQSAPLIQTAPASNQAQVANETDSDEAASPNTAKKEKKVDCK